MNRLSKIFVLFLAFLLSFTKQKVKNDLPPQTARLLEPQLDFHLTQSLQASYTQKDKLFQLLTDENFNSHLLVYNCSPQAPQGQQLISNTSLNQGYIASNLQNLHSYGIDYFAAILKNKTTLQDIVGIFKEGYTDPFVTLPGGYRTIFNFDANYQDCQSCIIMAIMMADNTWVIRQIDFRNKYTVWEYVPEFRMDSIFVIKMGQTYGYNNYTVAFSGYILNGSNPYYVFRVVNTETFKPMIDWTLNESNYITSITEYFGIVYNILTDNSGMAYVLDISNGSFILSQNLSLPTGGNIVCDAFYPYIACGNQQSYDPILVPTQIKIFTYKIGDPQFTYITLIEDFQPMFDLQANYLNYQFVYSTPQFIKVWDLNTEEE